LVNNDSDAHDALTWALRRSADQGLRLLEGLRIAGEPVAIVIADQWMPQKGAIAIQQVHKYPGDRRKDAVTQEDPTTKARRVWNAMAHRYDREIEPIERLLFRGGREWVCSRATGRVLEVAVGTGRNLPFYPPGVTITGIELSRAMLVIAQQRAADLGLDVELREGDAEALPYGDETFDTVVCTLSLCTIPNHAKAIVEMARVLRPGGQLLLLDHIGSRWWPVWLVQRLIELVTIRTAGEHMTRRPAPMIAAAGLRIVESQRLKLSTVERLAAVKTG
jgi:ubiquinone/menaquinone biosynthesis C-methylase UbiE